MSSPGNAEGRPQREKGARRPQQRKRTIQQIIYQLDNFCTTGAVVSQLVAAWAQRRNDALGGKLATDAYQIAVEVHALNARLVAVLEGTGQP